MINAIIRSVEDRRRDARIDPPRIAREDRALLLGGEVRRAVDVAAGVVEVEAGRGIDALYRADHLRGKQNVLRGDHLGEEIDARLVIDAGVEEHVLQDAFAERRPLLILRNAAVTAPVIGDGAAAMWDDQSQRREILE